MKSAIAAAYDANAAAFARSADRPVYRLLARPLVDVVEAADAVATPARPMLDVAAGTGALGRWCRDVVSVDLSAGQLAHNPNARRVLADAERLPFRDDAFRIACCAFGINHFPDPVAGVREMARVAPFVAVLTWRRPAPDYAPQRVLDAVLRHHLGHNRSPIGATLDELGDALAAFRERILPIEAEVARRASALHVPDPGPERDTLIAATALVHGLTVATSNVADFAPIGVPLVDPWST